MPESVLFVDRANACLSAIAEFAFRKATRFTIPATSAGISPGYGFLHWHARELLRDEGWDFEHFLSFRSKKASGGLLASHDLVVAFSAGDAEALKSGFPGHADKVVQLSDLCGVAGEVRDPCDESWQSDSKFRETFRRLVECSLEICGRA
ncbi:MAG: hypothetical protein V1787_03780 [Candidatus Micrarchaeota archaeon]